MNIIMPDVTCPRCLTNLEDKGEWWNEGAYECPKCMGMLTDKKWLESKLQQADFQSLAKRVSNGSPAGIPCPLCLSTRPESPSEMLMFQVYSSEMCYEVDGCLECGSMWFDHGELESLEGADSGGLSMEMRKEEGISTQNQLDDDFGPNTSKPSRSKIGLALDILDILFQIGIP